MSYREDKLAAALAEVERLKADNANLMTCGRVIAKRMEENEGYLNQVRGWLTEKTAEVERLKASRFRPGPIVQQSTLGFGWYVLCMACDAGALVGPITEAAAYARAEGHVHVYADAEGWIDTRGAWPS